MADPREEQQTRQEAPKEEHEVSTGRMHQNVPDWSDPTCACEAEPYWQAVADEEEARRQKKQENRSEPC